MDTTDTTSTETDILIVDTDSDQTEPESFGKEVTKTLVTSTATSAGVFAGFVVIALVTPKVKTWFDNRKSKKNDAEVIDPEVVEVVTETPAAEK
jgi:hypothetical protein